MAYEIVRTKSIKSTADQSSNQYLLQKIDTNGQLALCGAGGNAVGVLQDKPKAGDPGSINYPGDITKVVSGGVIAAGGNVSSDSGGKAVASTSGAFIVGIALTAATAANQLIDVLFQATPSKM